MIEGIEVIETEWGSALHQRLVAEEQAARLASSGCPEKTSNDRLHLEFLGEIIPKFLAEADRRGVDTQERREVLQGFLDRHTTPLSEPALADLREALLAGARTME